MKFDDLPDTIKLEKLKINGVPLEPSIQKQGGTTLIETDKFYRRAEPTLENPRPAETPTPLFNAPTYRAVLYFSLGKESDSITISDFTEVEAPAHP